MEISISAVTSNRKLSKALVRNSGALAPLEQAALRINSSSLPFDILQFVLVDEDQDAKINGCDGDRLFQIEISAPDGQVMDLDNQAAFVGWILKRIKPTIGLCGLPERVVSELQRSIDSLATD